jgi:hypothetical protein
MAVVTYSYIGTTEEADAILAQRLGTATWAASSIATKTAALQQATATIDALDYTGFKNDEFQELQFPRKYLIDPRERSPWYDIIILDVYGYYCPSTDVPFRIKRACALEANALVEYYNSSATAVVNEQELISKGVKSFSLGKLSMSFGTSMSATYGFKSTDAYNLLEEDIQNSYLIQ